MKPISLTEYGEREITAPPNLSNQHNLWILSGLSHWDHDTK